MPNPKGYIRDPDPPPDDAIVPIREPTMTDEAQERELVKGGGWRTEHWTPEELLGVLQSHEPGQAPYQAAREEILSRLRARQREGEREPVRFVGVTTQSFPDGEWLQGLTADGRLYQWNGAEWQELTDGPLYTEPPAERELDDG